VPTLVPRSGGDQLCYYYSVLHPDREGARLFEVKARDSGPRIPDLGDQFARSSERQSQAGASAAHVLNPVQFLEAEATKRTEDGSTL